MPCAWFAEVVRGRLPQTVRRRVPDSHPPAPRCELLVRDGRFDRLVRRVAFDLDAALAGHRHKEPDCLRALGSEVVDRDRQFEDRADGDGNSSRTRGSQARPSVCLSQNVPFSRPSDDRTENRTPAGLTNSSASSRPPASRSPGRTRQVARTADLAATEVDERDRCRLTAGASRLPSLGPRTRPHQAIRNSSGDHDLVAGLGQRRGADRSASRRDIQRGTRVGQLAPTSS